MAISIRLLILIQKKYNLWGVKCLHLPFICILHCIELGPHIKELYKMVVYIKLNILKKFQLNQMFYKHVKMYKYLMFVCR